MLQSAFGCVGFDNFCCCSPRFLGGLARISRLEFRFCLVNEVLANLMVVRSSRHKGSSDRRVSSSVWMKLRTSQPVFYE